jgi:hypothetical protein
MLRWSATRTDARPSRLRAARSAPRELQGTLRTDAEIRGRCASEPPAAVRAPDGGAEAFAPSRLRATTAEDGLLRKVLPQLMVQAASGRSGRRDPQHLRGGGTAIDGFASWLEQTMATRPTVNGGSGHSSMHENTRSRWTIRCPAELLAASVHSIRVRALVTVAARSRSLPGTGDRARRRAASQSAGRRAGRAAVLARLGEDHSSVDSLIATATRSRTPSCHSSGSIG